MRTRAVVGAALVIGTPLAWLAGEQHRHNCLDAHRADCSVLPWDNGESTTPTATPAQ